MHEAVQADFGVKKRRGIRRAYLCCMIPGVERIYGWHTAFPRIENRLH